MNQAHLSDEEIATVNHDVELIRSWRLWPYGSFLPLKHRVAVDLYGVSRTAILHYSNSDPKQKRTYIFLPAVNMYSIPPDLWIDPTRYRTGGEMLLYQIIKEGWIVQ
jgi:hypothetical protein